jgi:DNA-directed RNA polymerase specialized sigma24 family protein
MGETRTGEIDLVSRCLSGDEDAWRALHDRFHAFCREIVRSAFRRTCLAFDETDVEEAANDYLAFVSENGGRRLGLYRGEGPLSHYLAVLATNFARERAIRIGARRRRHRSIEDVPEPPAANPSGIDAVEHAELRGRLEAIVATLGASDRLLFHLLYRDGVEVEAACRVLRITPNALYIRRNRLKDRLRRAVAEDAAFGPFVHGGRRRRGETSNTSNIDSAER